MYLKTFFILVVTFSLNLSSQAQSATVEEISLSSNLWLDNDTLKICSVNTPQDSEFGVDYLLFTDNGPETSELDFFFDSYASIYINGIKKSGKSYDDLNLKTGDLLEIIRDQGTCQFCSYVLTQNYAQVKSQLYFVKIVENEETLACSTFDGQDSLICPGESVSVKRIDSNPIATYWKTPTNTASTAVTNGANRLGEIYLYEKLSYSTKACPAVSPKIEIKQDIHCKGITVGRVLGSGTNQPLSEIKVLSENGFLAITDSDGYYKFTMDSVDYFETVKIISNGYYPANDGLINNNVDSRWDWPSVGLGNMITYLIQDDDLTINVESGRNRPGFTIPYYLTIENHGKNDRFSDASITLDPSLTYTVESGEDTPDSNNGTTLTWNNITVQSGEKRTFKFFATLSASTPIQTLLNSLVYLTQSTVDQNPKNDSLIFNPEVTGAYDPNDKTAFYDGPASNGYVHDSTKFTYQIRFQNTGNDTAFNIVVMDVISNVLDLNFIETVSSSHDYIIEISGDTVFWKFNNILLADSNTNELLSHGFVKFNISQDSTNNIGTEIKNKAFIYFDFNSPIITNETYDIVGVDLLTNMNKTLNNSANDITLFPNPVSNMLYLEGETNNEPWKIINSIGEVVLKGKSTEIDVSQLKQGYYSIQINNIVKSIIVR
jgi:hypothetical protein